VFIFTEVNIARKRAQCSEYSTVHNITVQRGQLAERDGWWGQNWHMVWHILNEAKLHMWRTERTEMSWIQY